VPAYKPSSTDGFEIESIDYTDADINNVRRTRRVLSAEYEDGFLIGRDLEEALV
jgi:hypothetical protein